MYTEKFQNILLDNEQIIRIEKIRKKTFILKEISTVLIAILIFLVICKVIFFPLTGPDIEDEFQYYISNLVIFVNVGFYIIVFIKAVYSIMASSNYFICLTNKRILIRYGLFTTNYRQFSIENVTGNINTSCRQSIFDKKDGQDASCTISTTIELLPVGHGSITIRTDHSIENGYEMMKEIEMAVKNNAKINGIIKE